MVLPASPPYWSRIRFPPCSWRRFGNAAPRGRGLASCESWCYDFWLVVSTHLKNMCQIGSFLQVGARKKYLKPPTRFVWKAWGMFWGWTIEVNVHDGVFSSFLFKFIYFVQWFFVFYFLVDEKTDSFFGRVCSVTKRKKEQWHVWHVLLEISLKCCLAGNIIEVVCPENSLVVLNWFENTGRLFSIMIYDTSNENHQTLKELTKNYHLQPGIFGNGVSDFCDPDLPGLL